ncbi:MAG: PCP reductase family protein [Bacteroidetes bacterium]|nr:PCP reductase family protein [Bacteroidota bacterium]
MKFLCVPCDQPMNLHSTHGPFDGTMSIVYECPSCDVQMAMLTNKAETQMVRSLGVKIGGRTAPAEPMETLRSSLAVSHEESASESSSGGRCPFTGVISDAMAAAEPEAGIHWSPEALTRLEAIPSYIQPMVKRNIEDYARDRGLSEIDEGVMDAMKGQLGM